jgi:hypothetical protein
VQRPEVGLDLAAGGAPRDAPGDEYVAALVAGDLADSGDVLGRLAAAPSVREHAPLPCPAVRVAEHGAQHGTLGTVRRLAIAACGALVVRVGGCAGDVDVVGGLGLELVGPEQELDAVEERRLAGAVRAGGDVDAIDGEGDCVGTERPPPDELDFLNLRHRAPGPRRRGAR